MTLPGSGEPLRVMDVIARLNVGGPAIQLLHVAALSRSVNHEHRLVTGRTPDHEAEMDYLAADLGVAPHHLDSLGPSLDARRDIRTMLQLQAMMESFQPHVVHTHTAKAGFVGRWAAHRAGVPVIVHTYHGHVLRGYFGIARSRFFTMLERKAAGWSRQIIALSESLRDELVQQYRIAPRDKFTVMPLGLDLEPFLNGQRGSGEFRRELRIASDAPLIGMVGRLAPIKNPAAFLSAAEIVRRALPAAHFVMVGDGELRAALETQAQHLNLQDSLHITGWKRDLRPVYADLDLLVLCSRNEGTPVAIIEALAAGCPVVATEEGGIPEILEHGRWGRLTSADPPLLAQSILDALEHPVELAPVRQILRERHDPARHVHSLDALYRRLLAESEIAS